MNLKSTRKQGCEAGIFLRSKTSRGVPEGHRRCIPSTPISGRFSEKDTEKFKNSFNSCGNTLLDKSEGKIKFMEPPCKGASWHYFHASSTAFKALIFSGKSSTKSPQEQVQQAAVCESRIISVQINADIGYFSGILFPGPPQQGARHAFFAAVANEACVEGGQERFCHPRPPRDANSNKTSLSHGTHIHENNKLRTGQHCRLVRT